MTPISKKVDTPQTTSTAHKPAPPSPVKRGAKHGAMPGVWISRLLLAVLWFFGTEFLFWNDPQKRLWSDWLFLAIGYLLLATLALDWIVRYRVRDIWGVFVIIGVFGLLNGMLLNPQQVFEQLPNTILSHALGGYWWIGLEMFGLWAFLHRWQGENGLVRVRLLLISAIVVGFFWGVLVAWLPQYNADASTTTYAGMMYLALALLVPTLILWASLHRIRPAPTPQDYQLQGRSLLLLGAGILGIALLQLVNDAYADFTGLLISSAILGIFWLVLWLRDSTRKPSMIADILPLQASPIGLLIVACIAFAGMAQLGTTLPLVSLPYDINQFSLLTLVFSGVGVLWIPVTTAMIGIQTFNRQLQTGRL